MQSFNKNFKITESKTAVALGFFDGVHLGHRAVISAAAKCAQDGLMPVVYTFDKSPKQCISGIAGESLSSAEDKRQIIASLGIERFYAVDFNEIKQLSPQDFVSKILYGVLNAAHIFCGFNYRFGAGAEGNAKILSSECEKYDIRVTVIPPVMPDNKVVSSTEIRAALKNGDVESAGKMLGRHFSYGGEIIAGRQLGRTFGTPTINQRFADGMLLPKFGVYASDVTIDGSVFRAVTNIGVKPTVGADEALSESWLIDYNGPSLYGKYAKVELLRFLRPEYKFPSVEELKNAILADGKKAACLHF